MNVLFVSSTNDILSPQKPLRTPEQMQFGISYISSLLKMHGHDTKLLVLSRILGGRNRRLIDDCLNKKKPKLICFTAVSTEYGFIANMARYVKNRYPDIYLLAGGPHVSLSPEKALLEDFDALCIGEGEYPTLEFVSQMERGLSPSGIRNLWIKRGSGVERNLPRPLLEDLDKLPFPDWDMWQEWIEEDESARHPVLLGRGCPFECTYCCNHALRKMAKGRYVRFRSPDNILEELKALIRSFPGKRNIYLEVETIGADNKWAIELCSKLESFNSTLDKPLSFGVNLRIAPNIDFESLFTAFRKSNFKTVNIGVESGSERVRHMILKRNYSNEDIINAVTIARKHGLEVDFYNLIGIPGETRDDFNETIKINRICQPDKTYNHIFFPYPGTKLYEVCEEESLLPKVIDTNLERCKAILNLPGFTKREIQHSFVWFDYNVYKGHRPISKILHKVLVSKLRSNSYLHYFYRHFTYSPLFKGLKKILKGAIS